MSDGIEKTEFPRDAEFEAILDRELGRVISGRASVDECCAANAGFAEELRPLLNLALSAQAVLQVDADLSENEEGAREKLTAQAKSFYSERKPLSRKPGLRPLALASALFLLFFAGTALAASSASPDSLLYPLKEKMEAARTRLAIQELDQARVEAGHANKRLDELEKMIDEGKSEYAGGLLASYERHINDASAHAAAAAAQGEDTSEVDSLIASVRERHSALLVAKGLEEQKDEPGENVESPNSDSMSGDSDSGGSYPPASAGEPDDHGEIGGSGGSGDSGDSGDGYEQPNNDDHGDSIDSDDQPHSSESDDDKHSEEDSHRSEAPRPSEHER